ncbi:DNA polymerase I [Cronobacter sakazakii 696]|nr:DNA polymerase I [Cronobacter sakazakii 696]
MPDDLHQEMPALRDAFTAFFIPARLLFLPSRQRPLHS